MTIKSVFSALTKAAGLSMVPHGSRGWSSLIHEPFTGAWQKNKEDKHTTLVSYPTLYACISRIVQDIGKLPFVVKRKTSDGIWVSDDSNELLKLLEKPNHYQTGQQYRECYILSKITQGNTYVLKERQETTGKVIAGHVLDPYRVIPLVSESGEVFYQLYIDNLNLLTNQSELIVPASEIIHDRCICLFHPLIGVPPIAAANLPALKNLRILRSAAEFFGNNANPSGILSAPGAISDETAKRLSEYWNLNFGGKNSGKVAVVGDDLKFVAMSAKSVDAQMVEQLRYSDEQMCQPFGIHPYKVGIGSIPAGLKVDDINQLYYSDALQTHIESMENLHVDGLKPPSGTTIELNLWPLLRMDPSKQADVETKLVGGTIKAPNEARRTFDLPPKDGGNSLYMQQQNYSLEALAKRDAKDDPFEKSTPTNPEPKKSAPEENAALLALFLEKELTSVEHS